MGRRRWTRARTDASSTQIQASTGFSTTVKWSDALDMRDFDRLTVFFNPTTLTNTTTVDVVTAWSDDLATVPFDDVGYRQQSDFNIANFTDGSFFPKTYTATFSLALGTLAENKMQTLTYPVKVRYVRVGVISNIISGFYNLRAQRLVV